MHSSVRLVLWISCFFARIVDIFDSIPTSIFLISVKLNSSAADSLVTSCWLLVTMFCRLGARGSSSVELRSLRLTLWPPLLIGVSSFPLRQCLRF